MLVIQINNTQDPRAYCSPRAYYFVSFRFVFFYFIFFMPFFLYYFHIVLKFVPSHEIHRRPSSFVPRARVDFPVESFHKFNIADLKVYSDNTALRTQRENNADRRRLRFERCKWHTANTTRPFCVIDFNSSISTLYSLSFSIFFSILYSHWQPDGYYFGHKPPPQRQDN